MLHSQPSIESGSLPPVSPASQEPRAILVMAPGVVTWNCLIPAGPKASLSVSQASCPASRVPSLASSRYLALSFSVRSIDAGRWDFSPWLLYLVVSELFLDRPGAWLSTPPISVSYTH